MDELHDQPGAQWSQGEAEGERGEGANHNRDGRLRAATAAAALRQGASSPLSPGASSPSPPGGSSPPPQGAPSPIPGASSPPAPGVSSPPPQGASSPLPGVSLPPLTVSSPPPPGASSPPAPRASSPLPAEGVSCQHESVRMAARGASSQQTGEALIQSRGGAEVPARPADQKLRQSQDDTEITSPVFGDQPSAGPAFRYDQGPVRRKADRQKLPGWACNLCKEWYADRGFSESQLREHMNRCSRHRQREPPPPDTPPGFWDPLAFPSMDTTQFGVGLRSRTRRKL
ncbi:proline-rich protein 2-like [Pollicipes pollicipes]|nr:proline-rich protein 2-like [Pollicipes pollicipes]